MHNEKEVKNSKTHGKFGFFGLTPNYLQVFNNPLSFLVGVTIMMAAQGFAIIGLIAVIMPQIEKRYNFSSFDIGMIAAANDVAAVVFGLAVAHYGNFGNKVKWVGVGGIITCIGFIIFTLPQYIIEKYQPPEPSFAGFLCSPPMPPMQENMSANVTLAPPNGSTPMIPNQGGGCNEGNLAEWYYLALFLIGQFIAGAGSISLFSFIPSIFQTCVTEHHMPLYLAIWQGGFFLGSLIAFGVSGPLLELWVDIDKPKGHENMKTLDPRYIGNWWIGFIGAAIGMFISSIFVMGFPVDINSNKGKQEYEATPELLTARQKIVEFPSKLKRLMTNWAFIFNSMGTNCILMYIEGLAPFISKILYLHYGVEVEDLGAYLSAAIIPSLVIGVFLGAFVTRCFNLKESGKKSALLCFLLKILSIAGPIGFRMPGCNEMNLAGWKVPYTDSPQSSISSGINLAATCNAPCGCHIGIAAFVCGSDGLTYLGPCQAGCLMPNQDLTVFYNCSCIGAPNTTIGTGGTAKIGTCDQDCKNWLEFLVLIAFVSLVFFALLAPSKYVMVRCISAEDLSFAFGLQYFSTKIFAHIPGPIIFGHVIDLKCLLWQEVCDEKGFCWVSDVHNIVDVITLITGILVGLAILFFFLSWFLYKDAPPPKGKAAQVVNLETNIALDQSDETKL